jgi:hypothetical protein
MEKTISLHQKVMCNGYPGIIVKIHTGKLTGMCDVRLDRGMTTVSITGLTNYNDLHQQDLAR